MEECLINLNKGEDDEGWLKFSNILNREQGKFLNVCLETMYNTL